MNLDKANQQLTVASRCIPYLLVGDTRQPWFQGKALAEALDYSNTRHAVANNVEAHHRKTLEELRSVFGTAKVVSGGGQFGCPPFLTQPGTVFVDEAGMWSLLFNSSKPEAARIRDWVFSVVLPEIRRTGAYVGGLSVATPARDVMPTQVERVQMAEGTMRTYQMMLEMNMATETDRVLFADVARNAVMPLSSRPALTDGVEGEEQGQRLLLPLSDIYRQVRGRQGSRGVLMKLGRVVAAEYRQRHDGRDPPECERFVDGTTRVVKSYSPSDDPWITDFVRDNDI